MDQSGAALARSPTYHTNGGSRPGNREPSVQLRPELSSWVPLALLYSIRAEKGAHHAGAFQPPPLAPGGWMASQVEPRGWKALVSFY